MITGEWKKQRKEIGRKEKKERKIISHIASKQILIYLYHKTENAIISVN